MDAYNKLVRDKLPEYLDLKGVPYEKRIAGDAEYKIGLTNKLEEKLKEFQISENVERLADIIEVVEAIKKLPEFTNVEGVRLEKREAKGGFDGRIILKI